MANNNISGKVAAESYGEGNPNSPELLLLKLGLKQII